VRALTAILAVFLLTGVFVAGASAATTATTTTTGTATSGTATSTTGTATTTPGTASATAAAAHPKVTLSPTGSGKGQKTKIAVGVSKCPAGSITITSTLSKSSHTISGNGKPATVVSHGTPGTFTITATCASGAKASAKFVVTKQRGPSVSLSPSSTGPVPKTVDVKVQGCPPGNIKITDTINSGTQTIKKNGAPATIPSPGTPGTYQIVAKCTADGMTAGAGFMVTKGSGPTVALDPSSTGPVTRTIDVDVTGCPPGNIKISDTINGGVQMIRKDAAPATIVSQGDPGTYTVTAKCMADAAKGHAQFVVTPDGPIQTGGGATFSGDGPGWTLWTGAALLALGLAGGLGLVGRRVRGRSRR
jgi:coenzyme F420-reducing hydrogenase gamma subunit